MPGKIEVTQDSFDSEIADGVVVVDFHTQWCGPCKMMSPIVDELADELAGTVKVLGLDVDQAADVAARYGVSSVPTFIIFRSGNPVKMLVGHHPKDILAETIEKVRGA